MALQLKGCLRQDCAGISLFDTTGEYSVDNTTGYGAQNGVTGPTDFDTYRLRIWAPDLDPSTDDPTATIDLIDPPPTGPDDEGAYRWEFTLEQLGLTEVVDGVWYAEAVGVKDGDIYEMPPLMPIFTMAMRDDLKERLLKFDPSSSCKKGCESPLELWMMLKTVTCSGFCSIEQTKRVIDYLKSRIPQCC
jgi:hypothetical protein